MPPPEVPKKPTIKVSRDTDQEGLQLTWKDGLPDDPLERAQIEQIQILSGITSKYSAIKRSLDGDGDAAEEEMKRIEEERAAQQENDIAMAQALAPPEPVNDPSKPANMKAKDDKGGKPKPPPPGPNA